MLAMNTLDETLLVLLVNRRAAESDQELFAWMQRRIVFDTRQGRFDRPVIYRFDSTDRLRLLNPGGPETEIGTELARSESK